MLGSICFVRPSNKDDTEVETGDETERVLIRELCVWVLIGMLNKLQIITYRSSLQQTVYE